MKNKLCSTKRSILSLVCLSGLLIMSFSTNHPTPTRDKTDFDGLAGTSWAGNTWVRARRSSNHGDDGFNIGSELFIKIRFTSESEATVNSLYLEENCIDPVFEEFHYKCMYESFTCKELDKDETIVLGELYYYDTTGHRISTYLFRVENKHMSLHHEKSSGEFSCELKLYKKSE